MELKQKIKKQDVQRLRRLIQKVAEQNGEEAKLPFSFLPFRGIIMVDWVIMLAFVAVVLYCCYKSVYWEWNKLVVRGNKDVATWKAEPREASREAVEALESYIHEHTTSA